MTKPTAILLTLAMLAIAPAASAEPTAPKAPTKTEPAKKPAKAAAKAPAAKRGEITLDPIDIPGRLPRPNAAIDIARVSTRTAIPLRPFSPLGRIEGATSRAPF
jgi:hypothetical protein